MFMFLFVKNGVLSFVVYFLNKKYLRILWFRNNEENTFQGLKNDVIFHNIDPILDQG